MKRDPALRDTLARYRQPKPEPASAPDGAWTDFAMVAALLIAASAAMTWATPGALALLDHLISLLMEGSIR